MYIICTVHVWALNRHVTRVDTSHMDMLSYSEKIHLEEYSYIEWNSSMVMSYMNMNLEFYVYDMYYFKQSH